MVLNWQNRLCKLIEHVLKEGMPFERLEDRPKFFDEVWQSKNAEVNLLAALSACAWATDEPSKIVWPDKFAADAWISSLYGQRRDSANRFALTCLNHLNLRQCVLELNDFCDANMYHVILRGASVIDANLRGANLRGADLTAANLTGANLTDANLTDAALTDATLTAANLRYTNLTDATLKRAKLMGADLRNANLRDANLIGAYLRDANLRDANLREANLISADLTDADLRDVDVWHTKIFLAILYGAQTKGTNLDEAIRINTD